MIRSRRKLVLALLLVVLILLWFLGNSYRSLQDFTLTTSTGTCTAEYIEIPEAWLPTIKKHKRVAVQQRTHVGTAHQQSKAENYEPITAAEKQSITARHRVSSVYA